MEGTAISVQLQQPWLETHPHPPSSSSSSQIGRLPWSFSHDFPPPPPDLEPIIMDPALQFINDMLMEEDMDNRTCMAIESSAYQAMAKGFYDILGEDSSSIAFPSGDVQSAEWTSDPANLTSLDNEWIESVLNPDAALTSEIADSVVSSFPEFSLPLSLRSSGNGASQLEANSSVWFTEMIEAMPVSSIDPVTDVLQQTAGNGNELPEIWKEPESKSSVEGEEPVSFVRNKDLNAECNATLYRDGPVPLECCKTKHISVKSKHQTLEMVDLRGLLLSCAKAISVDDHAKAHESLQVIRQHASPYGTCTQRLAHYFSEALVARLSGTGPQLYTDVKYMQGSAALMLRAYRFYVEVAPFVTVSYLFVNQGILKAAEGTSCLHIVDYGILYGLQWPSLISALGEREGGPPKLRITGIEFPLPDFDSTQRIQESGNRLAEYARTYSVPFEFQAIAGKWENITPAMLNLRAEETLVVTCINRLRHLADETVIAESPRKIVLENIRALKPKLFVVSVNNAGLSAPFFLPRFREALFYFSSKLDMLDVMTGAENMERVRVESDMIGRDIVNIVACEGLERVERLETYRQWHARLERAGFKAVDADQDRTIKKAKELVRSCYHKDFGINDDGKWMFQEWKGRILGAISSWVPKKL